MRPLPDSEPATPDVRSPARYLLHLAARTPAAIALGVLYGVGCMLAQALVPVAIGRAVDEGLVARDTTALWVWAGAVLGLGVAQAATSILRDRCALTTSLAANYRTVRLVTRHAALLGSSMSRRVSAGEALSVGAVDATRIGRALEILAHGAGALAAVCVVAAVMLATSRQLGLVVLAGVPLMAWAVGAVIRPLHGRQESLREEQAALTSQAVDVVGGLRVLRGLGGEEVAAARYRARSQEVRRSAVRVARLESLLGAIQELLPGLLMVLVVWAGARLVVADRISVGQLVVFYAYAVFLTTPLRLLTVTANRFTRAHVAAGRVVRLLSLAPDPGPRPAPGRGTPPVPAARAAGSGGTGPVPPGAPGDLTDPETGLRVRAGLLTAVVCADPDAAPAIADRLGGYASPAAYYAGTALGALPREEVRRRILVGDHDAHLFSGTLRDTLAPAHMPGGGDAPLLAALRTASADDIAASLPAGLDEPFVQGGREFSGGQRQRLRLARALLTDPEVLVLVEPTNAVDAHTESRIATRLVTARQGRTTAVFTTSPALLRVADHVVHVVAGTVRAEGTHAQLLAEQDYRTLVLRGATAP
ncbi:ATP-binding cassette domain-containing protein [Streptomyces sp. PRKS01-65]|nr:ABC transporter ATP-binding protein [Streptomyces harenosi]NEY32742.1 ATP-binding cassette domain-containing protein [Streptomyces harenosi]